MKWKLTFAGALLMAMALQIVLGGRLLSATFDETTHLPSGYSYWRTGDFRLNPQHPPLIKLLAALPLVPLAPGFDVEGDPAWSAVPPDEWAFGYRFLYGQDADRLLFLGRLPIALLALLLAGYVGLWARRLHGDAAGLTALFLCAFSPTVLAHARFVTMDVGLAAFSTLALYHLWRRLRGGGRGHLLASGVGLGLALAAKFSGVVLVGAFALLIAVAALRPAPTALGGRLRRAALTLLALLVLAVVVVQSSYFFSTDLLQYWHGLSAVQGDHDPGYPYYLMGSFKPGGFWYYFALAFAFKTPLPTLLLLAAGAWLALRSPRRPVMDELCLVVPAAAYFVVTSLFADNLGVRYLLPVYPLVFVFAARVAPWALADRARRARRAALLVLGIWYAGSALWIFPDQLAYFNELAGGPARGHRLLDDSNIDWSQDLRRLKTYVDAHGIGRIKLHYGPNVAPDHYGIDAVPLSSAEWAGDPAPGVYAIGTHLLVRGEYYATLDPRLKTDWLRRYRPVGRVGYSIYVFEFSAPED